MGDVGSAFDEYLKSLSDDEWKALEQRVRPPQQPPAPTGQPLPGERREGDDAPVRRGENAGMAEARRRGYIDANGVQVKRA
ncbi:MAG: hypothetical protein PGN27_16855 [Mycolicibacterium neoaurum]|uniref:hypothetical protein n=1 Tax=Mycolicibacterium neoaurum TaxID=1795 RepID=UPI002FF93B94